MTLDDRIALQIGRAALTVARLETLLEQAQERIRELEEGKEADERQHPRTD